ANLAELRGDGSSPLEETINHVFCLSLPETKKFLKSYLAELAGIFPSKYFHLGCDEAWDVGQCPLCSKRLSEGETAGDLFAEYLSEFRDFVVDELGKEVIIWDDMFECYEGTLEKVPRDVILCCWQYGRCVDVPKAHFKNRLEFDLLGEYERLGFRYIFAPAAYYAGNIETISEYAAKHNPLGGLLTIWEKSLNFMHETLPLVRYSGKIWSGSSEGFEPTMSEFFGCEDEVFLKTLRSFYEIPLIHPTRLSPKSYLAGPLTEIESILKSSCEANASVLKTYIAKVSAGVPKEALEDILVTLEWRRLMYGLREAADELYSIGDRRIDVERRSAIIAECTSMIDAFLAIKMGQWERLRSAPNPIKLVTKLTQFKEDFAKFADESASFAGLLTVKFCLPDM
ncbi:MAG: family 20 glycosylhydrolase, partial [Victivallales bacterium]|nr:family 20 glycosylhydrolase [Victivallales bacterium]